MDGAHGPAEGSPPAVMGELYSLMRQHRRLLQRAAAREDVHPAQALCLRVLAHCDGVTQSELADAMFLTRPTVTRMLQRMERAGLVDRRTDPDDQRHTRVVITGAGREIATRIDGVLAEYLDATLARFSENDRRQLGRLLRTWRELADDALLRLALDGTDLVEDLVRFALDEAFDEPHDATGAHTRTPRGSTR
jgi:MarR family transcriptional regulator, organic hydroperoxide resistance regulator